MVYATTSSKSTTINNDGLLPVNYNNIRKSLPCCWSSNNVSRLSVPPPTKKQINKQTNLLCGSNSVALSANCSRQVAWCATSHELTSLTIHISNLTSTQLFDYSHINLPDFSLFATLDCHTNCQWVLNVVRSNSRRSVVLVARR